MPRSFETQRVTGAVEFTDTMLSNMVLLPGSRSVELQRSLGFPSTSDGQSRYVRFLPCVTCSDVRVSCHGYSVEEHLVAASQPARNWTEFPVIRTDRRA